MGGVRATVIAVVSCAALALSAAPAVAAPSNVVQAISPQGPLSGSDYDLISQAQLDMLRLDFGWPGIQPNPGPCTAAGGACDWGYQDRRVGAAAARGIGVMATLYGSAPFINPDPAVPPLADLVSWQQFVRAAVERYGPGGAYWQGPYQAQFGAGAPIVPVTTWQIWNEESSFQFFHPKPNTKQYAQILVPASDAIRSVDPAATIMLGGVFGETGPKGIPLAKFFKQLYRVKGIAKKFDAVAIHPYALKAKDLLKQVLAIRKATLKAKDKKVKVWVTELGYASGCAVCTPDDMPPVVTRDAAAQAKALIKAHKVLIKSRKKLNLGGIVWFSWQDINHPEACRFCQTSGLVDVNGQPKPAYFALLEALR
jgi:polysaccharide biosynthesis protein PslG